MLKCNICFKTISKRKLKLHLTFAHQTRLSSIIYTCSYKACGRTYSDYRTLHKHQKVYKHFEEVSTNTEELTVSQSNINTRNSEINISNDCTSDCNDTIVLEHSKIENARNELRIDALTMISSLQSDATFSRKQSDRITCMLYAFFNTRYFNNLKQEISAKISPNSKYIVENFDMFQHVFKDLDNEYKRNKILTNLGYNIEPTPIFFGTIETRDKNVLKTENVYGQLISLQKVLKVFFEMGDTFSKTCKYITSLSEDINNGITNIIQTSFWKSKIANKESITLPLFLYEDAFETANPLGSHAGIYKLNGVYVSIPCLPPDLYSKLNNIFLAQLYHADDCKLFPKERIYSYLIKELQLLETEGIPLVIEDSNIQVYFKLVLIIGDNLGLHSILGFVEAFSANICCRFCKVSKNMSRKLCCEDVSALRNKINYAEDVAVNNVNITGIKGNCAFNVLHNFHAVENYSVDIMHDLLEGVCVYEISYILYHFIVHQQYFTLDTLNWRLQFFNFNVTSSRPPTISSSQLHTKSIKMSASEMLNFFLSAGLIFGDLITDSHDRHWELFILLRKILCITLQYSVTESTADLLENLINEHHMLYIDLFGETLKPKHHLMLHYPRIMKIVGPLRSLWSMRFEAKHRPLKQYARASTSRRNICYSISVKHQLMLASYFITLQYGGVPYITYVEDNSLNVINKVLLNDYTNNIVLKSVSFGNVTLTKGSIVLFSIDNDECPIFVEIIDIFKITTNYNSICAPSDFIANVKYLFTKYFSTQYQAYAIHTSNKFHTVNMDDLQFYKVYTLIEKGNCDFYINY